MKLLTFFMLIAITSVSAKSYSQTTTLTFNFDNVTVSQVFRKIEQNSDYILIYNEKTLDINRKVTVKADNDSIDTILDKVFTGTTNSYKISGRQIVISESESSVPVNDASVYDAELQQVTVAGRVTDKQGAPLTGVTVLVKGTTTGVVTNQAGEYSLTKVPQNATLIFTFIGMTPQEIPLNNQSRIDVVMKEEVVGLEEVVVVGYGVQKKITVTGSITTIGTVALLQSPTASVANSLTGRVPGLASVQYGGQPGVDDPTMYIRGISSLSQGRSLPLIIVDGVERPFSRLDPNEIESISILKDASSTAVYGVRGANGVIIVATKRGGVSKPVISFSSSVGLQRPTRLLKIADSYTYASRYTEAQLNDDPNAVLRFDAAAVEAFRTNSDPILYPNTNWTKLLLKPFSLMSQHNINIRGGDEIVKYFVSVGYKKQDGLWKKLYRFDDTYWYDQYNLRANLDITVTKSTTLGITIGGTTGIINEPRRSSGAGGRNGLWNRMYWGQPFSSPGMNGEGSWIQTGPHISGEIKTGIDLDGGSGLIRTSNNTLNLDIELNQKLDFITKGLRFRLKGANNNSFSLIKERSFSLVRYYAYKLSYFDPTAPNGDHIVALQKLGDPGQILNYSESTGRARNWYMETGLNYNRSFGLHNVTGLLMYNENKTFYPGSFADIPVGYVGLVGRATYNYDLKYFLEFNVGYNGSENFIAGKRFGLFPAISAGWLVSQENFFKNVSLINYLKLRGSFGLVGNDQIGGRRFFYFPDAYTANSGSYYFGTTVPQSQIMASESTLGNPDVTWEKSQKSNYGIDLKLFKEKLAITFDYFFESRTNILINRQTTPGIFVVELPAVNLGKVDNHGYEVELEWRQNKGNFGYFIGFNMSFSKNKIIFMDELQQPESYLQQTGQMVNQSFGYVFDGFWSEADVANKANFPVDNFDPHPGDMRYKDLNGDKIINALDQKPIGYPENPEYSGGLKFGINYKNFDMFVLWNGVTRTSRFLEGDFADAFGAGIRALPQFIADSRWTPETAATATYPRLTIIGDTEGGYNRRTSDFWLKDASYLRLKNIELGYNLKNLDRLGIDNLRIFINGNDLLTFDKLKINDPEARSNESTLYPLMNIYNMGLTVTFK